MSNEDILRFMDQVLSVRYPADTPRTVLLSKLDSMSIGARNL